MTPDLLVAFSVLIVLLALEEAVSFYLGRETRLRHGLRNGSLALANAGIGATLAPLSVLAVESSSRYRVGLLHQFAVPGVAALRFHPLLRQRPAAAGCQSAQVRHRVSRWGRMAGGAKAPPPPVRRDAGPAIEPALTRLLSAACCELN